MIKRIQKEAGGSLRKLLPFFVKSFQFFCDSCFFSGKLLAPGKVGPCLGKIEFVVDLPVPLFQFRDPGFHFFQGVFFFAFSGLFLLLGGPVQRGGGGGAFRSFCRLFFRGVGPGEFLPLFQIIVVIAYVVYKGAVAQIQDSGGRLVDKVPVMADIEDGAGVLLQGFLQDLLGGNVQMVGRLVQQQEVGLGQHQLGQRQPSLLPRRLRILPA